MLRHLAIILFSVVLSACNTNMVKEFVAAPEVKSIQLLSFSAEQKEVTFEVTLYNPNAFPLPISRLSGEMSLNDQPVAQLSARSEQYLAAGATQAVTLPLSLNLDAISSAAKHLLFQLRAHYQFDGEIETHLGQIPLKKQGELSAQTLLKSINL